MHRLLVFTITIWLLVLLGSSTPSCTSDTSLPDPELSAALSTMGLEGTDLEALLEVATLSPLHRTAMLQAINVPGRTAGTLVEFGAAIEALDERTLAERLVLRTTQRYPNSCFGHSLLETMTALDPILALAVSGDAALAARQETEIMAWFHGGHYHSQTMEEFEADPYADDVLGGVSPEQMLPGAQHFLTPSSGRGYRLTTPSNGIEALAELLSSLEEFPEHPVLLFSMRHVVLALELEREGNETRILIHNPINASLTWVEERVLSELFELPDGLAIALGAEASPLADAPELQALLEEGGFPLYGLIVPLREEATR